MKLVKALFMVVTLLVTGCSGKPSDSEVKKAVISKLSVDNIPHSWTGNLLQKKNLNITSVKIKDSWDSFESNAFGGETTMWPFQVWVTGSVEVVTQIFPRKTEARDFDGIMPLAMYQSKSSGRWQALFTKQQYE